MITEYLMPNNKFSGKLTLLRMKMKDLDQEGVGN